MSEIAFVLSGGIGNIIQATPAIKAVAAEGHDVDIIIESKGTKDLKEILQTSFVRKVYIDEVPKVRYDYQLRGHFLKSLVVRNKKTFRSRIKLASHKPEAGYYYDLAVQMGVKTPMGNAEIHVGKSKTTPPPGTVAIWPGSKPNWSMKRWDKYDELAKQFENVTIVGTPADISSHGEPAWIKRPWAWPTDVGYFTGSLQESANYIAECDMFIGNDGGLAHVSAATGVTTFIIFGPSSVGKNKPHCQNAHAIYLGLDCQPCQYKSGRQYLLPGRASCPMKLKCMKDLSVDYVMSKIKQVTE